MSAFVDFEDKNVDKAIEKACKALNTPREKLKYDIISHGSSGIFGIVGTKKALIRVAVPDPAEARNNAPPVRPARKGGRKAAPGAATTAGTKESAPCPEKPVPDQDTISDEAAISALVDEAFGVRPAHTPEAAPKPETTPDPESLPESLPGTDSDGLLAGTEAGGASAKQAPVMDIENSSEAAEWMQGFLDQAILLISPDSGVLMETDDNIIRFKIQGGDDAARLIGKRGQTLDALQYIAEKAVSKMFGPNIHVEIDVENYLEKRRADLKQLANRLADKACQTGKPMVINRINAYDRRIVHIELKENREIRTQSTGSGELRKLLILPKKKASPKHRAEDEGNGRQDEKTDSSTPNNNGNHHTPNEDDVKEAAGKKKAGSGRRKTRSRGRRSADSRKPKAEGESEGLKPEGQG